MTSYGRAAKSNVDNTACTTGTDKDPRKICTQPVMVTFAEAPLVQAYATVV